MGVTNKYKATITLGVVTLGFMASYPFSQTFTGGLIASGCSAAMVGGLADWFAVSALFRRPLGIPFRTEIIPRNRHRIEQAIIDMVEGELLTKDNIKKTLNHYDVASLLVRYLADYGGKNHVMEFLRKISDDILQKINPDRLGDYLADIIQSNTGHIKLSQPLAQALTWSIKSGYFDKVIDFILGELIILIRQPQLNNVFVSLFTEARQLYEGDMHRRKLAGQILERFGVSAAGLAALAQRQVIALLMDLKNPEHTFRRELCSKASDFAARLAEDAELQDQFEQWKNNLIGNRADLDQRIGAIIRTGLAAITAENGKILIHKWIGNQVDKLIADFKQDAVQQQVVGDIVRQALWQLIDTHHAQIGTIVRERLGQLSNAALVEFIEERVSNDLQMIRINGSVVGGLAGMIIFLLTSWW